jgi:putative polyketide hydroxylase
VPEALGIAMQGTAGIYRSINVLLRADLTPWVADRPAALYFIEQPGLKATFLTINGVKRWGFLVNNLPVDGPLDDYTPERCAAVVRQAAGVPELDVEILGAVPGWPPPRSPSATGTGGSSSPATPRITCRRPAGSV